MFQCSVTLRGKKFFLMFRQNTSTVAKMCLWTLSQCVQGWSKAWISLLFISVASGVSVEELGKRRFQQISILCSLQNGEHKWTHWWDECYQFDFIWTKLPSCLKNSNFKSYPRTLSYHDFSSSAIAVTSAHRSLVLSSFVFCEQTLSAALYTERISIQHGVWAIAVMHYVCCQEFCQKLCYILFCNKHPKVSFQNFSIWTEISGRYQLLLYSNKWHHW